MGDSFLTHVQTVPNVHEGLLPTIFSLQMKSVQTIFHLLNIHFTTHGQDRSSQKKNKKSNDHGHIQVQFRV
jgi:hypothetical protein